MYSRSYKTKLNLVQNLKQLGKKPNSRTEKYNKLKLRIQSHVSTVL